MIGAALVAHSLRRARPLVIVVAVVLAGFQWLMTLAAAALQSMDAFSQILGFLPPAFRVLAGSALVPLMSFAGMVTVGYFHLIVLAGLIALVVGIGTEVAGELELRLVDLLLSRPLARSWLVGRTVIVLVVATLVVLAAMALGTWTGLLLFAPDGVAWPRASLVASLIANLAAIMLVWGTIALAVATVSRRRVVAGSLVAVVALAAFLVDYLARLWEPMQTIAWLSPFRYVNQLDLLTGQPLPMRDLAILASIAAAATVAAFVAIERRDV